MKATAIAMPQPAGKLQGRHVLAILVGFFGIVFAVNFYFMFAALSTNTGVVAVEPYRKGLAYNQRIAAQDAQNELGWKDAVTLGRDGKLVVTLQDRGDTALRGLKVAAMVGRPATEKFDHQVMLTQQDSGVYTADLGALAEGNWVVSFEARQGDAAAPVYRARHRLWLKP